MRISQCLHAALLVSDLERAEHFYSNVLGLSKVKRREFAGAWYQLNNFQIHLIVAPASLDKLQNPEKWGRNPHIAFAVADLDAAKRKLLAHNCPIQKSASGRAALFTQDPDNNIIEITEL